MSIDEAKTVQLFYDRLPIAIEFHRPDGLLVSVNSAWKKLWPIEPQKLLYQYNFNDDPQLKAKGILEKIHRALEGESIEIHDYVYDPKESGYDLPRRHLTSSIFPVKDGSDAIIGIIISHRDLTAQKEAEQERRNLEQYLQRAEKMESLGILAQGIGHDFSNVLQGLTGALTLVKMETEAAVPDNSDLAAGFSMMEAACHQAETMIQRLKTLSGKTNLQFSECRVSEILAEVIQLCTTSFETSITIRPQWDQNLNDRIRGDRTQLFQIFLNLLINARHAMTFMLPDTAPRGGLLNLRVFDVPRRCPGLRFFPDAEDRDYVGVSISDTGAGMEEEVIQNIFTPFFTTKSRDQGTGLGLAMVYSLVKEHSGFINVDSAPGRGSRFDLLFPAVADV